MRPDHYILAFVLSHDPDGDDTRALVLDWRGHGFTATTKDGEPDDTCGLRTHEDVADATSWADHGVGNPPGCGYWVWEGFVSWSGPGLENDYSCYSFGEWRPASAREIWEASLNAATRVSPCCAFGLSRYARWPLRWGENDCADTGWASDWIDNYHYESTDVTCEGSNA